MQRRREKDRLLKLAVRSKICSAMPFITCPSETRGYWLTERRNMSESWSWNVLSPPHTLVLWSSEFYRQLWLLMRIWLKGTEQLKTKWYCENSRLVVLAVLTPPSPLASWAFPSRSWYSPPFPAGSWSALPHPQCAHFKTSTGRFQDRLSSHLLPGWSGQPRVRTMSPVDRHPSVPTSRELRVSLLSSHVKWTHVTECTRLGHCCCPRGQRKELEHPAGIRIQVRNLVLTRAFFSFKNTKFELKIFRE